MTLKIQAKRLLFWGLFLASNTNITQDNIYK